MTAPGRPAGPAHDGPLPSPDHLAPASRAPVIVLATPYSGAERLRSLLEGLPDLACTSGTGILPMCEQALAAWRSAEGRPGGPPSALGVSSTRALVSVIISTILAREGKRRWCEACTATPEAAEAFLRLYPETRFVCLHRSCADVIRAALDASPWGITDPALAPFIRAQPTSTAAALTAYWAARTESLLAFEESRPQAALRIRLEDLATAEQATTRAIMSFVGITSPGSDTAPACGKARQEPGTPPAGTPHTPRPDTAFPVGLISPAVLARANDLLRQLGYPALLPPLDQLDDQLPSATFS
jgi:hypothetical protein